MGSKSDQKLLSFKGCVIPDIDSTFNSEKARPVVSDQRSLKSVIYDSYYFNYQQIPFRINISSENSVHHLKIMNTKIVDGLIQVSLSAKALIAGILEVPKEE